MVELLVAMVVASSAEVALAEEEDASGDEPTSLRDYQVASVQRTAVSDGPTRVAVETNGFVPPHGTFPVRVFIDNTRGPGGVVTISFSSTQDSTATVSRSVEVRPGERRVVNVPVFAEMRYGVVGVRGAGTRGEPASVYFQSVYPPARAVLLVGTPDSLERLVGAPPSYSTAAVQVQPVDPGEAPAELASYAGYDAVVVPEPATLEQLDEAQRRALEAYAATGGVVITRAPLRTAAAFPLLEPGGASDGRLDVPYGFGRLVVVSPGEIPAGVLRRGPPVTPEGPLPEYERRYASGVSTAPLLPQATAPLGRFLLIIGVFTVLIGPGSVWVARRRGPAALLVTIPSTALVTCVAIVAYSLLADGFTVHTATHGLTLLDRRRARAITLGVSGYYANLAPREARYSAQTAPVGPFAERREHVVADITWKDGPVMGSDFVPSRVYREWGLLSVEPSRARVVLKPRGEGAVIQNALGGRVEQLVVNVDGRLFFVDGVDDGAEAALAEGPGTLDELGAITSGAVSRFVPGALRRVFQTLGPGEFLAEVSGPGFVPTGGIEAELHRGLHWVRGEVD